MHPSGPSAVIVGQSFSRRAAIGAADRHGNFPRGIHELASASNLNSVVDADLLASNYLVRYEIAAGTGF